VRQEHGRLRRRLADSIRYEKIYVPTAWCGVKGFYKETDTVRAQPHGAPPEAAKAEQLRCREAI
jgi:hypothetical protein